MKPLDDHPDPTLRTDLQALLDDLPTAQTQEPARSASGTFVGTVQDTHNPDLPGRIFVRWTGDRRTVQQAWLRYACGTIPREGDTVLLVQPVNDTQWLVTAVLSGDTPAQPDGSDVETLRLQPGQHLRIESHDGTCLLKLDGGQGEVIVRLVARDVALQAQGRLRLAGDSVHVEGGAAGVDIRTDQDVVVRGRAVRIN